MRSPTKSCRVLGLFMIAIGLFCNVWVLAPLVSPTREFTLPGKLMLWTLDITCIAGGYLLAKYRSLARALTAVGHAYTIVSVNKEIITQLDMQYHFRPYFFLQPIPGYRNDFLHHPLISDAYVQEFAATRVKMELLEKLTDDRTTFSMSHLLENFTGYAFVDNVHYTPTVNALITRFIAQHIHILEQEGAPVIEPRL